MAEEAMALGPALVMETLASAEFGSASHPIQRGKFSHRRPNRPAEALCQMKRCQAVSQRPHTLRGLRSHPHSYPSAPKAQARQTGSASAWVGMMEQVMAEEAMALAPALVMETLASAEVGSASHPIQQGKFSHRRPNRPAEALCQMKRCQAVSQRPHTLRGLRSRPHSYPSASKAQARQTGSATRPTQRGKSSH